MADLPPICVSEPTLWMSRRDVHCRPSLLPHDSDTTRAALILGPPVLGLVPMVDYEGFCLKCKTYGLIKGGELIKMSNGRTRVAGVCSQDGCTGKIS